MAWERNVDQVELTMTPLDPAQENRRWKVVNVARNNADLGTLTLTSDESSYILARLIPQSPATAFEDWLTERLTNPTRYQIAGRKLSTMTLPEQVQALKNYWRLGKNLLPSENIGNQTILWPSTH